MEQPRIILTPRSDDGHKSHLDTKIAHEVLEVRAKKRICQDILDLCTHVIKGMQVDKVYLYFYAQHPFIFISQLIGSCACCRRRQSCALFRLLPSRDTMQTKDAVVDLLLQLIPQAKSGTLTQNVWENCFKTKEAKGVTVTCPLSSLDISNHCLSQEPFCENSIRVAAQKLCLDQPSPVFGNVVQVAVEQSVYISGRLKRMSEDIFCRSLAHAMFMAHKDSDQKKLDQLIVVAKEIPVLLLHKEDGLATWCTGFARAQQKAGEANLERISPLHYGLPYICMLLSVLMS